MKQKDNDPPDDEAAHPPKDSPPQLSLKRKEVDKQKVREQRLIAQNHPDYQKQMKAERLAKAVQFDDQGKVGETFYVDLVFNEIKPLLHKRGIEDKKRYCEIILANLFVGNKIPVRILKNHNDFAQEYPDLTYDSFIRVFTAMVKKGYILEEQPPYDDGKGIRTHRTAITATNDLINFIQRDDDVMERLQNKLKIDFPPRALIELRKDKSNPVGRPKKKVKPIKPKKPEPLNRSVTELTEEERRERQREILEYQKMKAEQRRPTPQKKKQKVALKFKKDAVVMAMEDRLEKINAVNGSFKIVLETSREERKIYTALHRVFKEKKPVKVQDKWKFGGRLYTSNFSYQRLSDEDRKLIRINDEPVVEYDFESLHPFMLFAKKGKQAPLNEDIYSMVIKDISLRDVKEKKQFRKFLKMAFLKSINCKDQNQAQQAIAGQLWKNYDDYLLIKKSLGQQAIIQIVEQIKTTFKDIGEYLFSGKGDELMNEDSEIALDVIEHFTNRNKPCIPCLPVHDSFIVPEAYSSELQTVMKEVYRKHTGFEINVNEK